MTEPVIVRFPPSPTGKLHVGNVRTLLFNYLFAKKHNGKIIFRVEDTDKIRSKREYEDYAKEAFAWLGMDYDEFHRQSERGDIYREYLQKLLDEDKAYISQETHSPEDIAKAQEEGKELRDTVIRFRNPNKTVTFTDKVYGEITADTTDLGDFVIAKDMDYPLYHFTVVLDDYLMGITHVIRGADHVSNTQRHILLQEALGASRPIYAHLPLVVGKDGKKFGKRHGATATLDYREAGYTPDAFINFMAFIGWNPGTDQEVFSREDLINTFSLEGIQKGNATFNLEKLDWFNAEHIKAFLDGEQILKMARPYFESIENFSEEVFQKLPTSLKERISKFSDLDALLKEGEFTYFFILPEYQPEELVWKKSDASTSSKHLAFVKELLEKADTSAWDSVESIKGIVWPYADERGRGDVLWPLRMSLSGRKRSADPFTLLWVLGKEEAVNRIQFGLDNLSKI